MVYFDFIAQKSQGTYPAKKEICDLLSYLLLTFTERTIHSPKHWKEFATACVNSRGQCLPHQ